MQEAALEVATPVVQEPSTPPVEEVKENTEQGESQAETNEDKAEEAPKLSAEEWEQRYNSTQDS